MSESINFTDDDNETEDTRSDDVFTMPSASLHRYACCSLLFRVIGRLIKAKFHYASWFEAGSNMQLA